MHILERVACFVSKARLRNQAVVLQVTGPFGAPAQKVWGFDTLMVVGAGIGVAWLEGRLDRLQKTNRRRRVTSADGQTSA